MIGLSKPVMGGIKIFIGVAILILLLHYVGIYDIIDTLATINILMVVPVFPILFINLVLGALALKTLYNPLVRLKFSYLFRNYVLSWSIGGLLPGRLGDFSLALLLKNRVPINQSTSLLLLDKMVTFFLGSFFLFLVLLASR